MLKTVLLALSLLVGASLGGCVSLGLSQQDSETAYTTAAIAANVAILSGDISPKTVGTICLVDLANYGILISTRNVADMVSYVPADTAHATLQLDGSKLNNTQCIPVTPAP